MRKMQIVIAAVALVFAASTSFAQAPAAQPMSFFITSASMGNGANLGGIEGGDKHCQTLATAANAGNKTWHAYLSTQGSLDGKVAGINARDRIGPGPWYNAKGVMIAKSLSDLHGDTLAEARLGSNWIKPNILTEKGTMQPGAGDQPANQHDVLTGTQPDGTAFPPGVDRTCRNWTSNTGDSAMLGHFDRNGGGNQSWNASHLSKGCSVPNLIATGGNGYLYCFAIN